MVVGFKTKSIYCMIVTEWKHTVPVIIKSIYAYFEEPCNITQQHKLMNICINIKKNMPDMVYNAFKIINHAR